MTPDSGKTRKTKHRAVTSQTVPTFILRMVGIVFALAMFWEFYMERGVLSVFRVEAAVESPMQHLWHVIAITGLAAIALLPPRRLLIRSLTGREGLEAEIEHLATHDALTGLPTSALFMDRLQQAMHRAYRDGNQAAVMFLDLDDFQSINDSVGHGQGDAVLKLMADRLSASVRRTDAVARFGGDQFVIVMTDISDRAAVPALADKLIQALAQPVQLAVGETSMYASIGIAIYPDHGKKRDALITLADEAMQEAKARGKGRYILAEVTE